MSKTEHYDSKGQLVAVEPTPKEVKIGELETLVDAMTDPNLKTVALLLVEVVKRLPHA